MKLKEIGFSFAETFLIGLILLLLGANLSVIIGITFILGLAIGLVLLEFKKGTGEPFYSASGTIAATLLITLIKVLI